MNPWGPNRLFAGANSSASNGLPIWRTWPTSTNAYAPAKSPGSMALGASAGRKRARSLIQVNADNLPVNLPNVPQYPLPAAVCSKYFSSDTCPGSSQNYFSAPDGEVFQSNGDIMIAGVIYNEPAFKWIRNGGGKALYEADVLTRMLPAKGQLKQVSSFPSDSIVLKHMYWPVPGDGCGALPVWDNPAPPSPSAYMGYETWTRAVAVATAGCKVAPGGTTQVSFLQGVQDSQGNPLPKRVFPSAKVVPLSSFYHQTFTQAALDALSANDRALLDASASWAYGRNFQAGDSIITIAMHIFTKAVLGHVGQSPIVHAALAKERVGTTLVGVGFEIIKGPVRKLSFCFIGMVASRRDDAGPPNDVAEVATDIQ